MLSSPDVGSVEAHRDRIVATPRLKTLRRSPACRRRRLRVAKRRARPGSVQQNRGEGADLGETDAVVNRKLVAAYAAGLWPIMCVGETLDQREQGSAESVVSQQLTAGSSGLTASDLDRIIVAYEPVWAIGTGRTATPEQAQEMHAFIRRVFAERHSKEAGEALRILYGGSVKPDNIAGLMSQPDIDGALVGGASLKAESFAEIVNYKR